MPENLPDLLQRLENTVAANFIRQSSWLYPALEIVHITGIVLLVGGAFLFDLRLLGFSKKLPVRELGQHLLWWSGIGLLLVVPSGLLLFSTNAVMLASDPVFHLKLLVIFIAGINAGLFHRFLFPSAAAWAHGHTPAAAKVVAGCSMLAWITVIACGRLLAY